jgi:hypothetical protein
MPFRQPTNDILNWLTPPCSRATIKVTAGGSFVHLPLPKVLRHVVAAPPNHVAISTSCHTLQSALHIVGRQLTFPATQAEFANCDHMSGTLEQRMSRSSGILLLICHKTRTVFMNEI